MSNRRILVHFTDKKVITTESHVGSKHVQALIESGYQVVGEVKHKPHPQNHELDMVNVFIEPNFFDPLSKYGGDKNVDTTTT